MTDDNLPDSSLKIAMIKHRPMKHVYVSQTLSTSAQSKTDWIWFDGVTFNAINAHNFDL